MKQSHAARGPGRPATGRRELFVAIALALSGLLLAACPGRSRNASSSYGGGSGGGMYRRY